ncbi:MAG TPA: hypothetical protein DD473_27875, partial [Planctomycetaceae bacterium]|nr:hypothetical protein [Planctomycetaceae bacterium]
YLCPTSPNEGRSTNNFLSNYAVSNYVVNRDMGRNKSKIRMRDVTDGTSNVLFLSERHMNLRGSDDTAATRSRELRGMGALAFGTDGSATLWAVGFDGRYPPNTWYSGNRSCCGNATASQTAVSSLHRGGVQVAMVDGSVRFVSENIDDDGSNDNQANPGYDTRHTWPALCTLNDGNVVGEF